MFEVCYGVFILLVYGVIEFGGLVVGMLLEVYVEWGSCKIGSVGKLYLGVCFRVIDVESNEELLSGEIGIFEVVLFCMGIYWICIFDIGYVDEDGFIFLCGRVDGVIMCGGFKVLFEIIEIVLLFYSVVLVVGVIGILDYWFG